jgi:hypothetical protein
MNQTIQTCGKPVKQAEPILDGSSSSVGSLFPSSQTTTPIDNLYEPIGEQQDLSTLDATTTLEPTTTKKNLPVIIGGSIGGLALLIILVIIILKR